MFLFARASGLRVSSATAAGFIFSFSGFFFAHLQHLSFIATASWLGWLLYVQNRFLASRRERTRRWRFWFALASIAIGMQFLSGFPQIALFNVIAFVAVGGFESIAYRAQEKMWKPALLVLAGVLLGGLIGAVQLLPTAELATLSTRGATGEQFFASYSLEFPDLPQFVSPYATLGEPFSETQEFWGFVGISSLLLSLYALVARRGARTLFFGAMALVALALTLGENNPVYSALYAIPIFNRFRVPARFLFLFTFAMANLAAMGLDAILERAAESPARSRWSMGLGALFLALFAGLAWLKISEPFSFWMETWKTLPWVFGGSGIVALVLAIVFRRVLTRQVVATLILGIALTEMTAFIVPFLYTLDAVVPPAALTGTPPAVEAMDPAQPFARFWTNNYAPGMRPNRLLAYRKPSAQIYSPLALERNIEYISALSPGMLNLIGVRYVLEASQGDPKAPPAPPSTLPIDFLRQPTQLPALRVARIEVTSFTSGTGNLPDGTVAGQVKLSGADGSSQIVSVRLGQDTAEWNFDSLSNVKHRKPAKAQMFSVSLPAQNMSRGQKFVAQIDLESPLSVNLIEARPALQIGWTIDRIDLYDPDGKEYSLATQAGVNDYTLAFVESDGEMYENLDALPRAFIVHRAEISEDANVLAKMSAADFSPERVAYLAEGQALDRSKEFDAARTADEVSIVEYRPERVTIRAKTVEAGYLILADSWYPGWVASVDGARAEINRADYIFRAIKLNAGDHTIVFEFQSAAFVWGAWISSAGALIAVGLLVL
jgi:hypothetical protein